MARAVDVEEHFAFGENWQSFVRMLDEERIADAEAGMKRLFPDGELQGARFLDIGCGSGLSSLVALRLGASEVRAVDVDPNSVAATRETLSKYCPNGRWTAAVESAFDLAPEKEQLFDIVYSWGVLHHTGDMWRAVRIAASLVKPGGYFAIALYRKTPFCGFWTVEKRAYSKSPEFVQAVIRGAYKTAWVSFRTLRGDHPLKYIRDYNKRGMDWSHDVHDWLGGYPYESTSPEDARKFVETCGFKMVREFVEPPALGLFGSGCDEYVARRAS